MSKLSGLRQRLNEDFIKSILTVLGGSTVSLALPVISSLWLLRIYDAALDFTPFALFASFCATLSALANSHYTTAILVADNEKESAGVLRLTVLINLIIAAGSILLLVFIKEPLLRFLKATPSFYSTVWLVPITVLLMGINAAFTQWAYRFKQFKRVAVNRMVQAVVTVVCQTVFGLYFKNIQGLIIGFAAGQLIASLLLTFKCLEKDKQLLMAVTVKELRKDAKKYNIFFRFQTPADIINVFTQQLPSFLLSKFAVSPADLGYYGQAYRLMVAPSSIITSAIADVFRQKANQDYKEKGNAIDIFRRTARILFVIMILPCLAIAFAGPWIFETLFGAQWTTAGVYAQILVIMLFPKFIVSPLTYMYIIARKQVEDFYLHIYILVSTILAFYLGYILYGTPEKMLLFFSINYAFIYVIYFFRSYKFAKRKTTSFIDDNELPVKTILEGI
ncbi:MAG: oligosaccharide flippase family protein [Ferruginibacter sp.]